MLIIIIYFATITTFAMVSSVLTFSVGSLAHIQEAFTAYVFCEASGIQTNSTCDRTELDKLVPLQIVFDIAYIIFVIFPVVNLIYAVNVSDIKALKKKCVTCSPGWCKKGKKFTVSIPLSSI